MLDSLGSADWVDFPEAAELQKQMATLEEKITNFKQEIVDEDDEVYRSDKDLNYSIPGNSIQELKESFQNEPDSKSSKPVYISDPNLPNGWTYFNNGKGSILYRDPAGKFIKSRKNVLSEMYLIGGFSREEIQYIRDGLMEEGWKYHDDLPLAWMFKQYTHKIEGVDTDVLLISH